LEHGIEYAKSEDGKRLETDKWTSGQASCIFPFIYIFLEIDFTKNEVIQHTYPKPARQCPCLQAWGYIGQTDKKYILPKISHLAANYPSFRI
jgi:hypothetical protein